MILSTSQQNLKQKSAGYPKIKFTNDDSGSSGIRMRTLDEATLQATVKSTMRRTRVDNAI